MPKQNITLPKPKLPPNFHPVQEFEVLVCKVKRKYLEVRLSDLTDLTMPDEKSDMRISLIPKKDHRRIKKGAVFYWGIGRYDDQITNTSNYVFDFKYAGRLTQEDLDNAEMDVGPCARALFWNG